MCSLSPNNTESPATEMCDLLNERLPSENHVVFATTGLDFINTFTYISKVETLHMLQLF